MFSSEVVNKKDKEILDCLDIVLGHEKFGKKNCRFPNSKKTSVLETFGERI